MFRRKRFRKPSRAPFPAGLSRPCQSDHRLKFEELKTALEDEIRELRNLLKSLKGQRRMKIRNRRIKPTYPAINTLTLDENAAPSKSKKVAFCSSSPRFLTKTVDCNDRKPQEDGKCRSGIEEEVRVARKPWRTRKSKISTTNRDMTTGNSMDSDGKAAMRTFGQGVYICKWQKCNAKRNERKKKRLFEKQKAAWAILCGRKEPETPTSDVQAKLRWQAAKRPIVLARGAVSSCGYKLKGAMLEQPEQTKAEGGSGPPGPGSYNLPQWPPKFVQNSAPFNSTTSRDHRARTEVPPVGSYTISPSDGLGKSIQKHDTWGGTQTIKLATMIRCSEEPYDWCVLCQLQPKGDYFYSETLGPLCRSCYRLEKTKRTKNFNSFQMETFKPARHCGYMHFHDAHYNIFTTMKEKDIRNEISREAYLARFQVDKTAVERPVGHPAKSKWYQKRKKTLASTYINPKIPDSVSCVEWKNVEATKFSYGLGKGKPPPDWDTMEMKPHVDKANEFSEVLISAIEEDVDENDEAKVGEDFGQNVKKDVDLVKKWRIQRYGNMAKYYNAFLPDFYLPTMLYEPDLNPKKHNYMLAPRSRYVDSQTILQQMKTAKMGGRKNPENKMSCEEKMKICLETTKKRMIAELGQKDRIERVPLHGITVKKYLDLIRALPTVNADHRYMKNRFDTKNCYCVPCDYQDAKCSSISKINSI